MLYRHCRKQACTCSRVGHRGCSCSPGAAVTAAGSAAALLSAPLPGAAGFCIVKKAQWYVEACIMELWKGQGRGSEEVGTEKHGDDGGGGNASTVLPCC